MNYVIRFFRFLKNNIGKISLTLVLTLTFAFMLFPLGDLSDFISAKISEVTGNQVYVNFNQLHLNPLSASVALDDVVVETQAINHLGIGTLRATPNLMALLSKKPGGTLTADGLLNGTASVKLAPHPDKNNDAKSDLEISLTSLSLQEIKESLGLSFPIAGRLNLTSQVTIDQNFAEQPEGELSLQVQKFELSSATVNLPEMGNLNIPEIKFSSIDIKSKFQTGKYTIENARFGSPADDLSGTVRGELNLTITNVNGRVAPVVNGYTLSIDILAKPAFKDRAGFFLSFLDRFQSAEASGTRYKFQMSASGQGVPPQMTPLQ